MARISISGMNIEYDLLGEPGAPAVALTPGGRYSKETPGLRELGEALAAGGRRVLLWDRQNCGASELRLDAENESGLHAETLVELIHALELGPTALAAGSAGSRVSLLAAARDPAAVSHLVLWWITGGVISLMSLASYYCGEPAILASQGGMAAVAGSRSWAEQVSLNPKAREVLLSQDPEQFIETMQRWASFYTPSSSTPVPGMMPAHFARLKMPVLIFRNGRSDVSHTRRTTDWVHELIPHSEMRDAPWPDDEWNRLTAARARGEAKGPFETWPRLAPPILEFTAN